MIGMFGYSPQEVKGLEQLVVKGQQWFNRFLRRKDATQVYEQPDDGTHVLSDLDMIGGDVVAHAEHGDISMYLVVGDDGTSEVYRSDRTGDGETPVLRKLEEGKMLNDGRYAIIDLEAHGNFGEVHVALDTEDGTKVAIKSSLPGIKDKFLRTEAEVLEGRDNDNVIHMRDRFVEDDVEYVVMEYAPGDITEVLVHYHDINEALLEIILQTGKGMADLHKDGIMWADAKPANLRVIFEDEEPVVKILDMGTARMMGKRKDGTVAGTNRFMDPEILADGFSERRSAPSDTYGLARTVSDLLTTHYKAPKHPRYNSEELLEQGMPLHDAIQELRRYAIKELEGIQDASKGEIRRDVLQLVYDMHQPQKKRPKLYEVLYRSQKMLQGVQERKKRVSVEPEPKKADEVDTAQTIEYRVGRAA